ncbi:MAG: exodeoxyribonuclease VII small subunit [Candidatus Nealsonbacteria bacterium]|nr:exodeoxyribonuclease VII small subunit [Candidatus Nealsonbacteria bacterium]
MTAKNKKEINLNENLKKLAEISTWFNSQKDIDLETGLDKVKEAALLIKESRDKLDNLENEFKEIEKEFAQDEETETLKESFPM